MLLQLKIQKNGDKDERSEVNTPKHLYIQWQENVAFARKCCIGKKMLHWQENVAFARKLCIGKISYPRQLQCKVAWLLFREPLHFPTKLTGKNLAFARKCCIGKKMLHLQDFLVNKSCIGKKMLHWQDFRVNKSCIGKKMLHWQDFLVNATFSCKCHIFLPLNVKVQRWNSRLDRRI